MDSWLKSYQLLCLPGAGSTWPDTPMTRSNIHPTTPLRQSWPSMQETTSLFGAIPMRCATNIQSKTFLPFSSSIFLFYLLIFGAGACHWMKIRYFPCHLCLLFFFLSSTTCGELNSSSGWLLRRGDLGREEGLGPLQLYRAAWGWALARLLQVRLPRHWRWRWFRLYFPTITVENDIRIINCITFS